MFEIKQKYEDYNGNEREVTLHFHLSKTDLRKMEFSKPGGGMSSLIKKIIETRDAVQLTDLFYEIVDASYGIKEADGNRFIKNKQVLDDFKSTEAYSEFCESLINDANLAAAFVNGVMPKDIQEKISSSDLSNLPGSSSNLIMPA